MPKINKVFNFKNKYTPNRKIEAKNVIINKAYNMFMNKYVFDNLDAQQNHFIWKEFWSTGKVAAFKLDAETPAYPNGLMVFTPFVENTYNIYDFAIDVELINKKGVPFIPTGFLKVNEEVCIGYAQRNHKPIYQVVEYYANKIADVESVLYMNLQANKTPWLLGVTPESRVKMERFFNDLYNDEAFMFIDLEDIDKLKTLITGVPYIIDKLTALEDYLLGKLMEYLGVNNLGVAEKKEHLITDEVSANNEVVRNNGDAMLDCVQEWVDQIKEVFGYDMPVHLRHEEQVEEVPEDEEQAEEDVEHDV